MRKNERDIDVSVAEFNSWPKLCGKVQEAGGYPVVLFKLDATGEPTGGGRGCKDQDEYKLQVSALLQGEPALHFRIIAAKLAPIGQE